VFLESEHGKTVQSYHKALEERWAEIVELLAEVARLRGAVEAAHQETREADAVVGAAKAVHESRVRGAVNLRAFATVGSIELGALGARLAELEGKG